MKIKYESHRKIVTNQEQLQEDVAEHTLSSRSLGSGRPQAAVLRHLRREKSQQRPLGAPALNPCCAHPRKPSLIELKQSRNRRGKLPPPSQACKGPEAKSSVTYLETIPLIF